MSSPSSPPAEEPSRIVAGSSPSTVAFGDAHITVDANSAVVVDQKSGKPTALLEHGAAVFAIGHGPFTVLVGDASIRVNSGKVRVARDGEQAKVTVETGAADVRFHGQEVNVAANHSWSTDHPTDVLEMNQPPSPGGAQQ